MTTIKCNILLLFSGVTASNEQAAPSRELAALLAGVILLANFSPNMLFLKVIMFNNYNK